MLQKPSLVLLGFEWMLNILLILHVCYVYCIHHAQHIQELCPNKHLSFVDIYITPQLWCLAEISCMNVFCHGTKCDLD